jgi:hypothetical protein
MKMQGIKKPYSLLRPEVAATVANLKTKGAGMAHWLLPVFTAREIVARRARFPNIPSLSDSNGTSICRNRSNQESSA